MTRARPGVRHLSRNPAALPAATPLIVFDDICVLCAGFVQWVIARDRRRRFRFTSARGALGQALYRDLGLDPENPETVLLVEGEVVYEKSAAILRVAAGLGGVWRGAAMLRVLPTALADGAYDRIARNRFALFGRRAVCWAPAPEVADRVL